MSTMYEPTPRTTPTRLRERASYDVAAVHAVLDEALVCHVGYVVDGEPVVIPTIHGRSGDVLYLHGSSGARLARLATASGGTPVSVTVTLVDGLVLARSEFHHSMNYRSVSVRGRAVLVTDPDERRRALAVVVEHVAAGRSGHARPPTAKELAATAVLRLPLTECVLKSRSGPPIDEDEDLGLPYWAGVLPVRSAFGPPEPAPELAAAPGGNGTSVPEHVAAYRRPRASHA
jgi:nitroimidazol reductase NimA-like FMN-containing flavoprotein (pyridoxamine 5'-phosphate oxidase superfamily)